MALKKKLRRLKNIEVNEVSLVDHPANMRKFLLFKRGGEDAASDKLVHPPELPDDEEQIEGILVNYEFATLSETKKQEILARIKKCIGILSSLEKSTIGEAETAVLKDIWRLEAGMVLLKGRNPGLFAEFCKADSDSLKNDWVYELDEKGIPLISKRIPHDNPFETKTHKFNPEMGRWEPKKR